MANDESKFIKLLKEVAEEEDKQSKWKRNIILFLGLVMISLFFFTNNYLRNKEKKLKEDGFKTVMTIYKIEGGGKYKRIYYCYFTKDSNKVCDFGPKFTQHFIGQKFVVYYDKDDFKDHIISFHEEVR